MEHCYLGKGWYIYTFILNERAVIDRKTLRTPLQNAREF